MRNAERAYVVEVCRQFAPMLRHLVPAGVGWSLLIIGPLGTVARAGSATELATGLLLLLDDGDEGSLDRFLDRLLEARGPEFADQVEAALAGRRFARHRETT